MERKVFLEKNRKRGGTNSTSFLSEDLTMKAKMLQSSNVVDNFSLFDQYNAERDACNRYRMVFVINPVCTNVLFNMQTEIVQNEGSDSPTVLGDEGIEPNNIKKADGTTGNNIQNSTPVTRDQAIRDTEYSHPYNGGFTYHCGVDIFNNHMLRSDGFAHVNKMNFASKALSHDVYNTLSDFLRDAEGNIVESSINPKNGITEKTMLHLYTADNSLSMKYAYLYKLKEKDGWVGFTNPGYIEIPNSDNSGVTINRMLSNKKPCEFIDMYPGRELYSFIPKYNTFRNRIEKNWDYCLTYPFSSDTAMVDTICGGKGGAMRAMFTTGYNSSTIEVLECTSLLTHTLKVGDTINIYYYDNGVFTKYGKKVKVNGVGNAEGIDENRQFQIRAEDVSGIYDKLVDRGLFYKKVSGGDECEYYFRLYKKLKRDDGSELRSDINKLAYAENIYGDREAQIIFTDDINLEGLCDHRGRPLSEVYFTVVKRNAGHEEWCNGDYGNEKVEYSHCFGKVTAGVDFGPSSGMPFDYNIRYIHNVDKGVMDSLQSHSSDVLGDTIWRGVPRTIGGEITIDDDVFYGDVVEFNHDDYEERVLSPVYHRFNTTQREYYASSKYSKILYDKFVHDDYDLTSVGESAGFKVEESDAFNVAKSGRLKVRTFGNICPEGYFYNPHTRIKLREPDDNTFRIRAKRVNYASFAGYYHPDTKKTVITMKAPTNFGFLKHDFIAFCDQGGVVNGVFYKPQIVWMEITKVNGNNLTLEVDGQPFGRDFTALDPAGGRLRYKAYYCNEAVPTYAAFNQSTQSFVWRGNTPPSEMSKDKELFDMPFANGRFYIEKNITFFMRRQDPFGEFGLLWAKSDDDYPPRNAMEYFRLDGMRLDLSQVFSFYNKLNNICY